MALSITLHHVDRALLSSEPSSLSVLRVAVGATIASEAGQGIGQEHVQVAVSHGSFVVKAVIVPPAGVTASSIRARLLSSTSLGDALVSRLNGLQGFALVAVGTISVMIVRVDGIPLLSVDGSTTAMAPPPGDLPLGCCANHLCPNGYSEKVAAESITCAGPTCTLAECCNVAPLVSTTTLLLCRRPAGILGLGVACQEGNSGEGFLMYSLQSVHARFLSHPPHEDNAYHFLCVRYAQGSWQYDSNSAWQPFDPLPGDVLLAVIDFDIDRVISLAGNQGFLNGIAQGYASGDLQFTANRWANRDNDGEFAVNGTSFSVNCPGSDGTSGMSSPDARWIAGNWTSCSTQCGVGVRSRQVACSLGPGALAACSRTAPMPAEIETCRDYGNCQKLEPCGEGGNLVGCSSRPLSVVGAVMLGLASALCCLLLCALWLCTRLPDSIPDAPPAPNGIVLPLEGLVQSEETCSGGRKEACLLDHCDTCPCGLFMQKEDPGSPVMESTVRPGDVLYTSELVREFKLLEDPVEPKALQLEKTRQFDDSLHEAHPSHGPWTLHVTSPVGQLAVSGEYLLVPEEMPNGQPLWKQKDGCHWLFSGNTGRWCIGSDDARQQGFDVPTGLVCRRKPHRGAMPHRVRGAWGRLVEGEGLVEDLAITVTSPDRPMLELAVPEQQHGAACQGRGGCALAAGGLPTVGLSAANSASGPQGSAGPGGGGKAPAGGPTEQDELEMGPPCDECVPSHWTIPYMLSDVKPIRPQVIPSIETWLTAGAKDLKRSSGKFYHEVKLGAIAPSRCVQLGWLTDRFTEGPFDGEGVGDDEHGWAVDGLHHKKWHNGEESAPWFRDWMAGDVIGLAIDIDGGRMQFSLNGAWEEDAEMSFQSSNCSLFPAVSMEGLYTMHIPQTTWQFSPPSDAFQAWCDSGLFTRPLRPQDMGPMYCVFPSGAAKLPNFSI